MNDPASPSRLPSVVVPSEAKLEIKELGVFLSAATFGLRKISAALIIKNGCRTDLAMIVTKPFNISV
jgi:hypothetical protein